MIATFGTVDEKSLIQLTQAIQSEPTAPATLCADHHLGYSHPIGGVVGYREHISLSGVGVDIACGNKAVLTNLRTEEIRKDLPKVMGEIAARVPCGAGRARQRAIKDHPLFERIAAHPLRHVRDLLDNARSLLGSMGGGNHYFDLLTDDEGRVWMANHFGSRGFGFKLAKGFMALAEGKAWGAPITEGYDVPAKLVKVGTPLAEDYFEAMSIAGDYAYAGRNVVINEALEVLGAQAEFTVHNHHNFCWKETHNGETLWVVRKGATPAFPGQLGFVGGSMRDISVVLRGVDSERARAALYSTVHGAGRVMSRTQAAGKVKRGKGIWQCGSRDCGAQLPLKATRRGKDGALPKCPTCGAKMNQWRLPDEIKSKGVVDFERVKKEMEEEGIVLIGAGADEAPECYKPLPEVLDAHAGTVEILHVLRPIGVLMAGREEWDPYGD